MSRKNTATTRKQTAKPKASRKPVPLSAVIVKVAERKGITTDKAGKAVRASLRRQGKDALVKAGYMSLADAKQTANDGNRWPAMPASFATKLVKGQIS